MMTTQLHLFIFTLVFFLLVFVLRSYWLWRNTGINPLTFDGTDDAHGFNGKLFKLLSVLEIVLISIYAFAGDYYAYCLPFWYLDNGILRLVGWFLLYASLLWIAVAQAQMAQSWRIGIDTQHETKLIEKGLFSISRNPIFLGLLMTNVGLFLVMPNAFMLAIAAVSFVAIQIQVRLEEAFLKVTHPQYEVYCKRVGRWW